MKSPPTNAFAQRFIIQALCLSLIFSVQPFTFAETCSSSNEFKEVKAVTRDTYPVLMLSECKKNYDEIAAILKQQAESEKTRAMKGIHQYLHQKYPNPKAEADAKISATLLAGAIIRIEKKSAAENASLDFWKNFYGSGFDAFGYTKRADDAGHRVLTTANRELAEKINQSISVSRKYLSKAAKDFVPNNDEGNAFKNYNPFEQYALSESTYLKSPGSKSGRTHTITYAAAAASINSAYPDLMNYFNKKLELTVRTHLDEKLLSIKKSLLRAEVSTAERSAHEISIVGITQKTKAINQYGKMASSALTAEEEGALVFSMEEIPGMLTTAVSNFVARGGPIGIMAAVANGLFKSDAQNDSSNYRWALEKEPRLLFNPTYVEGALHNESSRGRSPYLACEAYHSYKDVMIAAAKKLARQNELEFQTEIMHITDPSTLDPYHVKVMQVTEFQGEPHLVDAVFEHIAAFHKNPEWSK